MLQLYSSLQLKQGVILTGPSGSGKTTAYQVLAQVLNQIHDELLQNPRKDEVLCLEKQVRLYQYLRTGHQLIQKGHPEIPSGGTSPIVITPGREGMIDDEFCLLNAHTFTTNSKSQCLQFTPSVIIFFHLLHILAYFQNIFLLFVVFYFYY